MKKYNYLTILFYFIGLASGYSQSEEDASKMDYNNVSMPGSPTSSSFGEFGNTSVNIPLGIPTITIPIYTYEIDGVQVPISLAYDASGIKVGSLATSVGLNWSLEVGGQFTRTVRGKTDENDGWLNPHYSFIPDTFYDDYNENDPVNWQRLMKGNAAKEGLARTRDHMPDQFGYSFLGHSNSFIFDTDSNFLMEKQDGLEIDLIFDQYGGSASARDLKGNTFSFSDVETSNNEMTFVNDNDLEEKFYDKDINIPTAWKLSEITTKNSKIINFAYENIPFTYNILGVQSSFSFGSGCRQGSNNDTGFNATQIAYNFNTKVIRKISSPDGNIEVLFNYEIENIHTPAIWKNKLTSIVIKDLLKGDKKEFQFIYGRYLGDPRLKLLEMYEVGYTSTNQKKIKPSYKFTYKDGALPKKGSFSQDFFGFYNEALAGGSLVHMTASEIGDLPPYSQHAARRRTTDRSLNHTVIQNGILEKIQYPSGGNTQFTFEPNADNGQYYGGLRVTSIIDNDETGSYNKKTYQYESPTGVSLPGYRHLAVKSQGGNRSYNSSFIRTPGGIADDYRPGFFYTKVIIRTDDGSQIFKEENTFESDESSLHKISYLPKKKTFFRGNSNQPVKIEEYFNSQIGQLKAFSWNVLGDMMCYRAPSMANGSLGHNNVPEKVYYYYNYNFLTTRIVTTDFLKSGFSNSEVTIIKDIQYDPKTLLTLEEITDFRYIRTGERAYTLTDPNGEKLTTVNTYPFLPANAGFNNAFPKGLLIRQEIFSLRNANGKMSGQAFEFDSFGNIKTTYNYHKGAKNNNATLEYIFSNYEEQTSFIFKNGKPIQIMDKNGPAISFIWGHKNEFPVAKIEGKTRGALNQQKILAIESASYSQLPSRLAALRTDNSVKGAMITTFTHSPLFGVDKITDPKGEETSFYYDHFGRLDYVKDQQGNILTENEYNYGN